MRCDGRGCGDDLIELVDEDIVVSLTESNKARFIFSNESDNARFTEFCVDTDVLIDLCGLGSD